MPKPRPLRPDEARRTLAHRLGPRVDRLRQISTRFGLRPYRVFLVWTRAEGHRTGDGDESVMSRVELLPTPRMTDLTVLSRRPWSGGQLPEGTVRIDRISVLFTADNLSGLVIPETPPRRVPLGQRIGGTALVPNADPQIDFFYEVVEDGRGDDPSRRARFRLYSEPYRDAGGVSWVVLLEAASDPLDRAGQPRVSEEDTPVDDDSEEP